MNRKLTTILSTAVIGGLILSSNISVFAKAADTAAAAVNSGTIRQKLQGQLFGGEGHGKMTVRMGGSVSTDLAASLVKEGIISQETADKISSYFDEKAAEKKTEMEKVKAMTDEERKAYLESKKAEKTDVKKDPYAGLVEAGILTQAQADSIKAYDEKQREAKQEEQQAKRQEEMETKLDSLVSAGTITEALKTEITEYLNSQDEARSAERKAETEKLKTMTDAERKTYMESNKAAGKGEKVSPLKALVDAGTLTQAQADAVVKALFQKSVEKIKY